MNAKLSITQSPVAPYAGLQDASSKQQTKQKYQPSHQQAGLPPHSALPIRGKTNKQKLSIISSYRKLTNHWTKLRRAETKRKKEFNILQGKNSTFLEAWGKVTSNTVTFKKKRKKKKRQRIIAQMKEQSRNRNPNR